MNNLEVQRVAFLWIFGTDLFSPYLQYAQINLWPDMNYVKPKTAQD